MPYKSEKQQQQLENNLLLLNFAVIFHKEERGIDVSNSLKEKIKNINNQAKKTLKKLTSKHLKK